MADSGRPPDTRSLTSEKISTNSKKSTLPKRFSLGRKSTLPKSSTLSSKSPSVDESPHENEALDDSPHENEALVEYMPSERQDTKSVTGSIVTSIPATEIDSHESGNENGRFQFGELEFVGVGAAYRNETRKFVKVPKGTDPGDLLAATSEEWGWGPGRKQPSLLISVTGGAWDFPISSHVNEVFRKGIVEAAVSANAWIITGGTNTGVMKYVGTAVGDYEIATRKHGSMTTIGIATWGTLRKDHQDELSRALDTETGRYTAKLSTKKASQKGVFLDPNHSYFILVDDQTDRFGADVQLRGNLEKEMSAKWKVPGLHKDLPMVCIVVEGGPNTIGQAYSAVKNDSSIVVVGNSGRASNVMAKAFDENNEDNEQEIHHMLDKICDDSKPLQDQIKYMMQMTHLVNVYKETSTIKIDQMILRALINANKNDHQVQLDLAQTWDRSDIVEFSEILSTNTLNWKAYNKTEEKYRTNVHRCLINNQLGFIKLFLENKLVQLDAYLTKEELRKLYKQVQVSQTSPLYNLLRRKKKLTSEPTKGVEYKEDILKDIEGIVQDLTTDSFVFLSDDNKAGYDWYQTRSSNRHYQFELPQIPEDRKTITFRVKAARDASIALSPSNEESTTMYEIILGSAKNDKCVVKYGTNIIAEVEKVSVLDPEVFRHFFITFDRGIQVGFVGEKPFMMCQHSSEIDVRFLGFRTDIGIHGVWEFCTFGYDQYLTSDAAVYQYDLPKIPSDKSSFTFRVKTDNKAYIALSPKKEDADGMLEIVLSNQSSEIRLGKQGKAVAKESTSNILSGDELRHFYVTFEPGKQIQIGVLGQKAFLKYKPSNKFLMNYIGYATDVESRGIWEFSVLGSGEHKTSAGVYKYDFSFLPLPEDTQLITFQVKSGGNALLALSAENKPSEDMYEIMLGIEKNQKSGITQNNQFQTQVLTEKVLTWDKFRHFYILLQGGSIQVGVIGEKPFMKHERHATKFDIKYLGFCSDYKSVATWDFCVFGFDQFETSMFHFDDLPKVPKDRKIITFRVKAAADVRIALISDKQDKAAMYEIGLGVTNNKMSVLNYGPEKHEVAKTPTPLLLSEDDFRHFYICVDPRKPIQVGEVGKKPILKHKADEQFDVNYVGFATGNNVAGVFEFCTFEFLDGDILPDPMRQLFLFAILNKYYDLAEYFWEEGQEHIAAALTASLIYKNIAKDKHDELKMLLQGIAQKYEDLAYNILTECENESEGADTLELLMRIAPNWGYANHLQLAEATESKRFMSHAAVQTLLNKIWCNDLPAEGGETQSLQTSTQKSKYTRIGDRDEEERGNEFPATDDPAHHDHDDTRPKTRLKQTKAFFEAPRTKFVINLVMYVVFLIFFSHVMVSDQLSKRRPSGAESFLIFWVVTFIMEEIRQLVEPDMRKKQHKGRKRMRNIWSQVKGQVKNYIADYWNWIDITMLSLFVLGEFMRMSPNGREAGRIILAFSLFLFYFRFLHYLTLSRNIGPKVFMIFKMLGDLRFMILILVIILVGYGTAVQAIMYPHVTDTASVVKGILYRPIFQIYGEFFLDDLTAQCENGTTGTQEEPCPQHVGWGVFFMVIYVLLCNVLLLNLLIAMFSNTFQNVQEETDLHSKFQQYKLTKEYFNRPVLPPPLIVFSHIYRLVRFILHKIGVRRWEIHRMERHFSEGDERALIKMEERCAYNYFRRKRSQPANGR